MTADLLNVYRRHVDEILLPFWMRAVDGEHGGVFTCFNNRGTERLSSDKYTWSQGRFIWIWSRLVWLRRQGMMEGEAEPLLEQARAAVEFIQEHAFLESGSIAFLLTETGERKESIPSAGYDTSFYADCFVVLGFTEYARVSGELHVLLQALELYDSIMRRLGSANVRSEPYPAPEGLELHAYSMIMLNVSQELAEVLGQFRHARAQDVDDDSLRFMETIVGRFAAEDGTLFEMVDEQGVNGKKETLLCRYVNPGHTIECMWFIMKTAERHRRKDVIKQACDITKHALELGWDTEYGGLLRFVDYKGGQPKGTLTGDENERLILGSWDTKLWWPHSESMYTTLLAYEMSGDEAFRIWYEQIHEFTFKVFPNPDPDVGEWIQIRNRHNEPLDKIVALPVKDPYHILRNMLLLVELLTKRVKE